MVAVQTSFNKDNLLGGAEVITINSSKSGCISEKKYGEPLGETICVLRFEESLLVGHLIEFGDPASLVMDFIEQLSTR